MPSLDFFVISARQPAPEARLASSGLSSFVDFLTLLPLRKSPPWGGPLPRPFRKPKPLASTSSAGVGYPLPSSLRASGLHSVLLVWLVLLCSLVRASPCIRGCCARLSEGLGGSGPSTRHRLRRRLGYLLVCSCAASRGSLPPSGRFPRPSLGPAPHHFVPGRSPLTSPPFVRSSGAHCGRLPRFAFGSASPQPLSSEGCALLHACWAHLAYRSVALLVRQLGDTGPSAFLCRQRSLTLASDPNAGSTSTAARSA